MKHLPPVSLFFAAMLRLSAAQAQTPRTLEFAAQSARTDAAARALSDFAREVEAQTRGAVRIQLRLQETDVAPRQYACSSCSRSGQIAQTAKSSRRFPRRGAHKGGPLDDLSAQAPVLPEEGASRALPATTTTQNVTIPQGPLRAAALQNATPLHGTPRGSWPPSTTAGRVGVRATPPPPTSPPQGVAVPYVVTRASRPPSPPQGINTSASASGAQKALTSSGANHALSTTGAQRALADAAAQQALALPPGRAEQRTPPGRPEQYTPLSQGSAIVSARPPPMSVPSLPPPTPRVEATSKLAQPSRRTVLLLAAASGVVSFTLVGLFVSRMQRADGVTVESTPALQAPPTEPVIAPTPTPPRVAHRWNGTFTTADSRWSFVLSLRITGNTATGWFSWTAAAVPGTRVGEQVRENLEGTFDAPTNSFDVHGTGSTNQALLPVNAFRLRVMPDGTISGSTLDESERIVGTPAR